MKVLCLCPIFAKPLSTVQNALALFQDQDHPIEDRHLFFLDDSGRTAGIHQSGQWTAIGANERYNSLPDKYEAMLKMADDIYPDWDAVVPWDDDDIYFPWFLSSHVRVMTETPCRFGWSKPTKIFSNYAGDAQHPIKVENATGRFHGSCFFGRTQLESVGNWLGVMDKGHNRAADFDQRLIRVMGENFNCGDPIRFDDIPNYVYRWRTNNCSFLMKKPDDETWWTEYPKALAERNLAVPLSLYFHAQLDDETIRILEYANGFKNWWKERQP